MTNQLLPSTRSTLLTGEPSASFVLSRLLSSVWVSCTGSASDWCALQEALYKCIDTIQYNDIFSVLNYVILYHNMFTFMSATCLSNCSRSSIFQTPFRSSLITLSPLSPTP